MKTQLSIQERLKDLRVEKGMTLEQLSQQTKIPASTLGSYESDDYKEIPHRNIIELAKFYRVSTDYLLGLTENRQLDNIAPVQSAPERRCPDTSQRPKNQHAAPVRTYHPRTVPEIHA